MTTSRDATWAHNYESDNYYELGPVVRPEGRFSYIVASAVLLPCRDGEIVLSARWVIISGPVVLSS